MTLLSRGARISTAAPFAANPVNSRTPHGEGFNECKTARALSEGKPLPYTGSVDFNMLYFKYR